MAKQIIIKGTPVVAANEVLVADSSSKIPAVDGSAVTTMAGGNITGTIPTARLDSGTTANKLVVLGGSGLPAVDGSLLTGIVSHTTSASDPTISTNPATGVGTEWINSTSGKQFICTDATAGENVWKCSGGGSGDVEPYIYQGTTYGYSHGGNPARDVIERFSFTSDGDGADVGNLVAGNQYVNGTHSTTHGYCHGGSVNRIEKYQFVASTNSTQVGTLSEKRDSAAGLTSKTKGYVCGGYFAPSQRNNIWSYSYVSDGNATDVADLTTIRLQSGGSTDTVNGYIMTGESIGHPSGAAYTGVDKFVYATEANSTDIGDLTVGGQRAGGSSSLTYGYCVGGASPVYDVIDKFNFAGSFTATDVGNLVHGTRGGTGGSSSTTYGFTSGGFYAPVGGVNEITKFAFASDGNSTDVGNLTVTKMYSGATSF